MLNVKQYLCINIPLKLKTALAKFRCSNKKLQIELVRQESIDIHKRLCTFCFINDNFAIIECKYHAFFICEKYLHIRQSYLFSWYTSEISRDNYYFLMSNADPNVIRKISEYVYYLTCAFKD